MAWIVTIASPSSLRAEALGKYLAKLTVSSVCDTSTAYSETTDPRRARPPETRAGQSAWYNSSDNRYQQDSGQYGSRLVILQIVDAVFRTLEKHGKLLQTSAQTFATDIKPSLIEIVRTVSPAEGQYGLDAHRIIRSLLASWKDLGLYDQADYLQIRAPARSAYKAWLDWLRATDPSRHQKLHKRVKAVIDALPSYHGSHHDPWYRLPAATMIPLITGQRPISTARMKPLRLSADLDPELLNAVQALISNGNVIYSTPKISPFSASDTDSDIQLNGLGMRVTLDVATGKRKALETYYGYSPAFVEKMKRRRKNPAAAPAATPAPAIESTRPPSAPVFAREKPTPTPPPPPPPMMQFNNTRLPSGQGPFVPPPPPPMNLGMNMNMNMNFPAGFPPRPPNWNGPWPPPPPPPPPQAGGTIVPPPWMPPMGGSGNVPQHGQGRGGRGGSRSRW